MPYKEWDDFVRADIEVPKSKRKKVIPRGTLRVPLKYIERARAEAEKKKRKGRKSKGRIRQPKAPTEEQRNVQIMQRLAPKELDEATLAKLKPANHRPTLPAGHQYAIPLVKEASHPAAPKPVMPIMTSTTKSHQYNLMSKTVPSFMRRPRPAGSRRH